MSCDCRLCKRNKEFFEHMKTVREAGLNSTADFLEKLYEHLDAVELDRDVNQAIIEGTWPSSEQILAGFRDGQNKSG